MDSSSSLRSVHKELEQSQFLSPDTTVSADHIVSTASLQESLQKEPPSSINDNPSKTTKKRKNPPSAGGGTSGRWTPEEHEAFLRGLSLHGREWKRVAADIPTRTSSQVRSHAQKYFAKISKYEAISTHHGAMDWDSSVSVMSTSSSSATLSTLASHSHMNAAALPASVRHHAERILADPGSVEAEVKDTLQQLKTRYAELQQRLQHRQQQQHEPSDDERIALDVLQGRLSHP